MVDLRLVVTSSNASASALDRRLREAWSHLQSAPSVEKGSPREQLLAQRWTDVWRIEQSTRPPAGIADNTGEFLIILRDVGVYLADKCTEAVLAATAERLVKEAVQWLKGRDGEDSIELDDKSDDEAGRP